MCLFYSTFGKASISAARLILLSFGSIIFLKLDILLKGSNFESFENILRDIPTVLRGISENILHHHFACVMKTLEIGRRVF
jgi:hypothetical protein